MSHTFEKRISSSCKDLGLYDDYADGQIAKLWNLFIGEGRNDTTGYRKTITEMLRGKKCQNILDVACGTGVDSVMLLEEGFNVTSTDASSQMLKYALKERWLRRKEPAFDNWEIEEANWLTLPEDINMYGEGYDAVLCLGNSISDLIDDDDDHTNLKMALNNFRSMLKPGGYLLIDHLNYENLWNKPHHRDQNIYFNFNDHFEDLKTSALMVNGKITRLMRDYKVDLTSLTNRFHRTDSSLAKRGRYDGPDQYKFHFVLAYHTKEYFTNYLKNVFGPTSNIEVLGDFKCLEEFQEKTEPMFYVYIVQKT